MGRIALVLAWIAVGQPALANKSGLAPNRVSLPKGPGSLAGLGENVEPSINMGTASYGVTIEAPPGHGGLSPSLRLTYSSGGGSSVVGMGWALDLPTIERRTVGGLPQYDNADTFAADGQELVRLPGTSTFRARFEGSFVRYTWLQEGQGQGGYWRAEYPDGKVGYFGATRDGGLVAAARVTGGQGVFRYHLVEVVDSLGHRLRYSYERDASCGQGSVCEPRLHTALWTFEGDVARYQVELVYEARPDALSDCKPGFEVRQSKRLREAIVRVRGAVLRRYELGYESVERARGLSRLSSVRTFGIAGTAALPIQFGFTYTGNSGDETPFAQTVGSVGVDFRTGEADLIDLNGDHWPDVLDTTGGVHRVYFGKRGSGGAQAWAAAVTSVAAGSGAMRLSSANVETADLDGDGLADMLDAQNASILWNTGSGDWRPEPLALVGYPNPGTHANLRFFDYDHDKRIDVIDNGGDDVVFYRSLGDGRFAAGVIGDPTDVSFAAGAQLADINGDGLLDIAQYLATGVLRYRLYLGYGRWTAWREMLGPEVTSADDVSLVDINGDGLADLVTLAGAASAEEIGVFLNQNAGEFLTVSLVTTPGQGALPDLADASVRFADMNGNGSTDIVIIENPSGVVTYLELFGGRPNLLTRVENGIGQVVELQYGASTDHMARDGGPNAWSLRPPHPMVTLDVLTAYAQGYGSKRERRFFYRDGYYDGAEKQFRGFAEVAVFDMGDSHTQIGRTVHRFDVGALDPYRKGLTLSEATQSEERALQLTTHTYEDCALADVPDDATPPVRFVCKTATRRVLQEGQPESDWVTLQELFDYDGYGNVTRTAELGVTAVGGGACEPCQRDPLVHQGEPCGSQCLGDERYTETTFVPPAALWLLRAPYRKRSYGAPGGAATEELTYYDGETFVGLPLGSLSQGLLSRVTAQVDTDVVVAKERYAYDAHGNIRTVLDPNGHSRRVEYDSGGVLPNAEVVVFDEPGHAPYELRIELTHDPVLEETISATAWMRLEGGVRRSEPRLVHYAYDGFGRLRAIASPGDTLAQPTQSITYDLGTPVSRVITTTRVGSGDDLVSVQCFDGLGRAFQQLTRLSAGRYQTSGFLDANAQGEPRRAYAPYTVTSDACALTPPSGVPISESHFDATSRVVRAVAGDASIYGAPSEMRADYLPLATVTCDPEDIDTTSAHFGTCSTVRRDGLARTVEVTRTLSRSGEATTMAFAYDALGRLAASVDAHGNEKRQRLDLLGRVVQVDDPNTGVRTFIRDAAGNIVAETDGRGVTVRRVYDELNRLVRQWDEAAPDATAIAYTYDLLEGCAPEACPFAEGRLVRTQYPVTPALQGFGEDVVTYDARGRPTQAVRRLQGFDFITSYAYDNADRVVAVTHPDGTVLEEDLDGAGRTTGVPDHVANVEYASHGLLQRLELENGTVTTREYDAIQRLKTLNLVGAGGTALLDYTYERDRVANLVAITDVRRDDVTPSGAASYDYDALYRLRHARLDQGALGLEELSFKYDAIDNILEKNSSLGRASGDHVGLYTYAASGPHQVSRTPLAAYRYDAAGNRVTSGAHSYVWDHLGRLAAVQHGSKALTRMAYGPGHDRVAKEEGDELTLYVTSDFEVRGGVAITYVRVAQARVAKLESVALATALLGDPVADGVLTAADAYAAYSAEQPQAAALLRASARRQLMGDASLATYLHTDHQGSTVLTTDATGGLVERSEYYPFGGLRHTSGAREDFAWTGQEQDRSSGLSYHSARYLDTRLGRWTSADPLFATLSAQSVELAFEQDLYTYVDNDPLNGVDPDGLNKRRMQMPNRGNPFTAAEVQRLERAIQQIKPGYRYQTIRAPNSPYTRREVEHLERELFRARLESNQLPRGPGQPRPGPTLYVNPRGEAVSSDMLMIQGMSPNAGNFTGLRGASIPEIISRIPRDWTYSPQRGGNGIRFFDGAGIERIRLHGPHTGAPAGSNSRQGWTLRIQDRAGNYVDHTGRPVPSTANDGHIPIMGNPVLTPGAASTTAAPAAAPPKTP